MSPAEMTEHLEKDLRYLASLRAPIVHYKVCSTFDSSPEIGSIGRVIKIAKSIFGDTVPIVGGTPSLQRYCFLDTCLPGPEPMALSIASIGIRS